MVPLFVTPDFEKTLPQIHRNLTAPSGNAMMTLLRNEGELSPEGWPSGRRRLS